MEISWNFVSPEKWEPWHPPGHTPQPLPPGVGPETPPAKLPQPPP